MNEKKLSLQVVTKLVEMVMAPVPELKEGDKIFVSSKGVGACKGDESILMNPVNDRNDNGFLAISVIFTGNSRINPAPDAVDHDHIKDAVITQIFTDAVSFDQARGELRSYGTPMPLTPEQFYYIKMSG